MPRPCRQSGPRGGSAESWEEFLAEDDEETERTLTQSSRTAETARDLTKALSVYLASFTWAQIEYDAIRTSCGLLAN